MLGFAVIDRQQGTGETVVWLTSQVGPAAAANTNAVVIADTDDEAPEKFRAMVADRITVTTEGTTAPAPLKNPIPVNALGLLVDETTRLQRQIGRLTKPLPAVPEPPGDLSSASPTERTLAVANYVARVWTCWLATEDHLRRKEAAELRRGGKVVDRPAGQRVFPESFREQPEPLRRGRR